MKVEYYIYRKKNDPIPVVSLDLLPEFEIKPRRKFSGKKLKIEVIRQLSGVLLDQDLTTGEVNHYIEAHIYNTDLWPKYRQLYTKVANEVEPESNIYKLQYILIVELEDLTQIGNDNVSLDPADPRLIHLIRCELMGQPLKVYETMINPIVSLKKKFTN
jgi:hypothetical protein